jgi:TP53 regulating kinase-like protein
MTTSSSTTTPQQINVDNSSSESVVDPSWTLIFQGAEARVFLAPSTTSTTTTNNKYIIKQRLIKRYRHAILDRKLNKQRIKNEVRGMLKASKLGVKVPRLDFVDENKLLVMMEYIEGLTLKQIFDNDETLHVNDKNDVSILLGKTIAKLHSGGMYHGDLTTSNAIVQGQGLVKQLPPFTQITMLDFGLTSNTKSMEDFAVDLYVLERAFLSTHPNSEEFFQLVLQSYVEERGPIDGEATKKAFEEVRLRGRKRTAFG